MKLKLSIYAALCTALIAVGAYIKIPLPSVPLTLQFQFVNAAALLLGKKYGAAASCAYIALGLAGLPVFAGGGGIGYLLRPTFGYVLAFPVGAYIAGAVCSRKYTFRRALAAGLANLAVVYAIGAAYFYLVSKYYLNTPVGARFLFLYCFIITGPFDAAMCFLSAKLAPRVAKALNLAQYEK